MRDAERKTFAKARKLRQRMTRAEVILWQHLRKRQIGGARFRRQVPIGPYIADFACADAKLIIEVDGATHAERAEIAQDAKRTEFLEEKGWYVHRVWNTDVYDNLKGVLDGILHRLQNSEGWLDKCPLRPSGTSPAGGGGSDCGA